MESFTNKCIIFPPHFRRKYTTISLIYKHLFSFFYHSILIFMANIKQSTLVQKGGNVENHFIISGNDLADVVETALSKIREKSRSAYAEDMQDKLARGKEVFIDKHSGSGTYYTVIWESPIYLGKKYGEPFFTADMLEREGEICYNCQGSGFCITYTASGDTNEEFKIVGEPLQ